MMKRAALLASLLVGMGASAAGAAVTWTVSTSTSDMSPLSGVTPGATITLDITARSDESTFAVGASVHNLNQSFLTLDSGITSSAIFVQAATGPGTGFGGLDSTQAVALDGTVGDIQYFNGVSITGTPATGVADISPVTSVAGEQQFRVVLLAGSTPGATSITVGTDQAFGDAVVGAGGAFLTSNNVVIPITIPEPGAVASSCAALGSLALVVGIRRRR